MDAPVPDHLAQWRADGLLARLANPRQVRQVRRLKIPTVNLREEPLGREIPFVGTDAEAIVRVAVEHLVQQGLRRVAFVGFEQVTFSRDRRKRFMALARSKNLDATFFNDLDFMPPRGFSLVGEDALGHSAELAAWLQGLKKPVGILGCNDVRAQQVLDICSQQGIAVPDQVAILGIDNDPFLCQLSDPPMSSVDPNAEKIGYEAARVLHHMIESADDIPRALHVPPAGVVVRRSTDLLAIPNAGVIEAVRYVRDHACTGMA